MEGRYETSCDIAIVIFRFIDFSGRLTRVVLQGLAEHKDTLGAPLCPCRFVVEDFLVVLWSVLRINVSFDDL